MVKETGVAYRSWRCCQSWRESRSRKKRLEEFKLVLAPFFYMWASEQYQSNPRSTTVNNRSFMYQNIHFSWNKPTFYKTFESFNHNASRRWARLTLGGETWYQTLRGFHKRIRSKKWSRTNLRWSFWGLESGKFSVDENHLAESYDAWKLGRKGSCWNIFYCQDLPASSEARTFIRYKIDSSCLTEAIP